MPLPIQVGSITDQMRRFFRIRGRSKFQLDETVVPVVLLKDLDTGPFQAGAIPCALAVDVATSAGGTSQTAILINANAVAISLGDLADDLAFVGRSFTLERLTVFNRSGSARGNLLLQPVLRSIVAAALAPTTLELLFPVQGGTGISTVPVLAAGYPAAGIILTTPNIWRGGAIVGGTLGDQIEIPVPRGTVIDTQNAIIFTDTTGTAGSLTLMIQGVYNFEPA